MQTADRRFPFTISVVGIAMSALNVSAVLVSAWAAEGVSVSQRDARFAPAAAVVSLGEPLTIVNDDGPTVHHAYVESDAFDYDSGDQLPGARATIVFPARGRYTVLCGIHPRMKLDVTVK